MQLDGNSYFSTLDTTDMHQVFSFWVSLLFGSLRSILNDSFSVAVNSSLLLYFRNRFMVPLEAEGKTSMQKENIY